MREPFERLEIQREKKEREREIQRRDRETEEKESAVGRGGERDCSLMMVGVGRSKVWVNAMSHFMTLSIHLMILSFFL